MLSTRFTKHSLVTEVHKTIRPYLSKQSISIDATMGNGHDTLFLARYSQKVYAFDIQESALNNTRLRLETEGYNNKVNSILAGHETMQQHIRLGDKADAILFNLGYLPHADSAIITQEQSTLLALNQALLLLKKSGIISILAYPGHAGGQTEMQSIINWFEHLDRSRFALTIIHSMHNKSNAPRLFILRT